MNYTSRYLPALMLGLFLSLSPGLYAAEVLEGVEIERPGAAAPAAAEPEPRAVPAKPDRTVIGPGVHPNKVIVKFVEGSAVRFRTGNLVSLGPPGAKAAMDPLSDLISSFHGAKIERQFTRPEQDLEKEKVQGEARSGKELADLNNYYVITLKEDADTGAFIDALNAMDIVEIAYPEPIPEPAAIDPPHVPSDISPVTPDLSGGRGYLNADPRGVNASFAWTKPGGRVPVSRSPTSRAAGR